jgi:hypothetical protein
MHINPLAKFVVGAAAALAVIAPATIGEARGRPQIDYVGSGTYAMTEFDLFAAGSGEVEGTPFDGTVTFMLRTDDGTFPAPGECEAGFANFAVQGRKQELWGTSAGDVCGQFVSGPDSTVTVAYTGDYSIVESSRRLRDTEGWIEIRLATDNRMAVTLFDS